MRSRPPEIRTKAKGDVAIEESSDEEELEENVERKLKKTARISDVVENIIPRSTAATQKHVELPYVAVPPLPNRPKTMPRPPNRVAGEHIPAFTKSGPAFKNRAPVQDMADISKMVDGILELSVPMPLGNILGSSNELREDLKRLLTKARNPTNDNRRVHLQEEDDQESEEQHHEDDWISIEDLPAATYYVIDQECDEGPVGTIVMSDPVVQYLNELDDGEKPREIYVSKESHALRALYPKINKIKEEEALLDSGSQIISMAQEVAVNLGLTWDPDITINMQSANRQVEKTLGLAKNIPFKFGELTVYLQVHIIRAPAYHVLLGRPFDTLTSSIIQNDPSGEQIVTIKDPFTGRKCVLPTYARGETPGSLKKSQSFQRASRT